MAKGWLFLGRNKQSKTEAVNVDNGALEVKTVGNNVADLNSTRSAYDYELLGEGKIFLCERYGVLYTTNQDRDELYKSMDGGGTWSASIFSTGKKFVAAHKTAAGSLIIFASNDTTFAEVYRSTDDVTFTEVLTGVYRPWPSTGIDSNESVVMFAEYQGVVPNGTEMHVYRSSDDGATWDVVRTDTVGVEGFAHYHNCQYIGPVMEWLVTTGDGPIIKYLLSTNNGNSWITAINQEDQRFRTLGIVQVTRSNGMNRWIWSSDGSSGNHGIFYIDLENPIIIPRNYTPEMVSFLPSVSYGITGKANMLMATTNNPSRPERSYIYISNDGGDSWQIDKTFSPSIGLGASGIANVHSFDRDNNAFLNIQNVFGDVLQGVRAKPNLEIKQTYSAPKNGRSNHYNVIAKKIYNSSESLRLSPPRWAQKGIFVCRVFGVSGTDASLEFRTNHYLHGANTRGPFMDSVITNPNRTAAHYWGPGLSAGANITNRLDGVEVTGLPVTEAMFIELVISGTFVDGEGIETEVGVTWLP